MIKKTMWIGLALSLVLFMSATTVLAAQGEPWNKRTVITFSQPVEVPGHVLPAGTYTFKLLDSLSDRHIVQIFNADESQIIATIMAIPDYRLISTDETVIKFQEVPRGSPEAIRAWFYPGNTIGQEFVYPKQRAAQLAEASKAVVPAIAADVTSVDDLKTASLIAITPELKETTLTAAIQTTPVANAARGSSSVGTTGVKGPAHNSRNSRDLPQTASALPLVVLLGLGSIGAAFGLMVYGKHAASSAV